MTEDEMVGCLLVIPTEWRMGEIRKFLGPNKTSKLGGVK